LKSAPSFPQRCGGVFATHISPEPNLGWGGIRKGELVKLEDFGGPGLMEANDRYCAGHAYPQIQMSQLDETLMLRTQHSPDWFHFDLESLPLFRLRRSGL
jgi:hypothetical protein